MDSWQIGAIFSGTVFGTCLLSILFLNISSHSQKILLFLSRYNSPRNLRGMALCRTQFDAPDISPLSHTHMLASFWVSGSGDANFTFILDFYHSNFFFRLSTAFFICYIFKLASFFLKKCPYLYINSDKTICFKVYHGRSFRWPSRPYSSRQIWRYDVFLIHL
jgi:hypothetical protein